MQQTTNYKLNKPEYADTEDVTKLNENMDILDTEIKKIDTKVNNISVSVQSVNTKTGAVVLNATDIKMSDGTTIEAKVNAKADSFNKSDSVSSTSSTDVATSYAVKQAYDKGVSAYNLANGKQSYTVITEKLPTDLPSAYPLGYSTFYTPDPVWKTGCGITSLAFAVVETIHAKLGYGITQTIIFFSSSSHDIQAIFERASCSQSSWGSWTRILDNTTTFSELNTSNKTIVGAINEVLTRIQALENK